MKQIKRIITSSVCCTLLLSGLPALAAHDNNNTGKSGNTTASTGKGDNSSREHQLGWVLPANHLIGHKIENQQGNNLGEIRNLALDFESGRVLYVVVDPGTSTDRKGVVAVPASLFRIRDAANRQNPTIIARVTPQQLANAPRMTSEERQNLSDVSFATQVYKHFNQPIWWTADGGQFGHVRRAAQVPGQAVHDSSNQKIGTLDQVLVDLPAGRIAYATLKPTGQKNQSDQLVLVPPMALTKGDQGFVLNADQEKLRSAPQARLNQQRRVSDLQFANQVYQYWGKSPWFQEGLLAPTGRSSGSGNNPNQNSSANDDENDDTDDTNNASTSKQFKLND